MPILIECPNCHKQLRVQDTMLGKRVKCPSCMTIITATAPGSAAPAPAAPRPAAPPPPREEVVDYQGDEDAGDEGDDREERRRRRKKKARRGAERVRLPAIFMLILGILGAVLLIVGGTLNLLQVSIPLVGGQFGQNPGGGVKGGADPFNRPGRPGIPDQQDVQAREDFKSMLAVGVAVVITICAVALLLDILIIFGSVQMMRCRMYGLAVTAAILSMVFGFATCFSCSCLGLVFIPMYLAIGIWALVVLMSADVKAAFA